MIKVEIKTIGKYLRWKGRTFPTPTAIYVKNQEVKALVSTCKILGIHDIKIIEEKENEQSEVTQEEKIEGPEEGDELSLESNKSQEQEEEDNAKKRKKGKRRSKKEGNK